MRRTISILIFVFSNAIVNAAERGTWRWYYSAFESPERTAGVFLRSGQATVKRSEKRIEVQFRDAKIPELNPVFLGSSSGGKIEGTLSRFFVHDEDMVLFGDYRSMQFSRQCSIEEIVLRPKEPTGAVLVLSRTTGTCDLPY